MSITVRWILVSDYPHAAGPVAVFYATDEDGQTRATSARTAAQLEARCWAMGAHAPAYYREALAALNGRYNPAWTSRGKLLCITPRWSR